MKNPEYLEIPVADIRPNPWNTNQMSGEMDDKVRASIERNGIFKPIIVREVSGFSGYEVVGGEHRLEQAIELGFTTIPAMNLGPIDDMKAKEIGVIDNARYGHDDAESFAALLSELSDTFELQDYLPYDDVDLDLIMSSANIALEDLETTFEEEDTDPVPEQENTPKLPKTHALVRFKVPLGDAEKITALVAHVQNENAFTGEDQLTNAGDALVHLLAGHMKNHGDDIKNIENVSEVENG